MRTKYSTAQQIAAAGVMVQIEAEARGVWR
jgi:hypothetical protein